MATTNINIQIYGTREKCYPVLKKIKEFLDGIETETRGFGKPTVTYGMHKVIYFDDKYFEK